MMTTTQQIEHLNQALEEHSKKILADEKLCEAFLKEMGVWHLLVPIKKSKWSKKRRASHRTARKK